MKLYLARHGETVPESLNPDRPLSESGIKDLQRFAGRLATQTIYPSIRIKQIIHSGKTRAQQTAEIFAKALSPGCPVHVQNGLMPNDPVMQMVDMIDTWEVETLLVGHLPYLGTLLMTLVGPSFSGESLFYPGEWVCLTREAGDILWEVSWRDKP